MKLFSLENLQIHVWIKVSLKPWFIIFIFLTFKRLLGQARSQDFCWGGAFERLRRKMSSTSGVSPKGDLGVFSPRKFLKNGLSEAAFRAF